MPHSAFSQVKAAISRVIHGEMYYSEFVGYSSHQLLNYVSNPQLKKLLFSQGMRLRLINANKRLLKYFDGQRFDLNGVFLPDIRSNDLLFAGLSYVYNDLFRIHCEYSGNYNYKIVDPLDLRFSEGTYFYIGPNEEKIIVKSGDIVIDAGAWIGDFSALAAYLVEDTGTVYAFEPSYELMKWLKMTASYYPNLIPVPFGLGSVNQKSIYHNDEGGGGSFVDSEDNDVAKREIKRLDDWVLENKIPRIDFIKADIEGFERKMLMGAKRVLRDFGPTLSICTYHLPDDPVVLERIILESNHNYKVIQRRSKLFAFIP
ncbi:MAG: FkbM family methyltransferase [Candidatus Helarchaeota archaeon]